MPVIPPTRCYTASLDAVVVAARAAARVRLELVLAILNAWRRDVLERML